MRGLFLDNLTGLVGDVFKGVANSTSRMRNLYCFTKERRRRNTNKWRRGRTKRWQS